LLLLAARQLPREVADAPTQLRKPLQLAFDALIELTSERVAAELEVLAHGEVREDGASSHDEPDTLPTQELGRGVGHVAAVETDRSPLGFGQTGQHTQHGGLAGAVRARRPRISPARRET